mmetsp:Transcript_90811/g.157489  ORF Transcript_90811/g.157489 Transcript_90811/m.157489 type:complete len:311 (+) Transcript_90811:818-1750(+)
MCHVTRTTNGPYLFQSTTSVTLLFCIQNPLDLSLLICSQVLWESGVERNQQVPHGTSCSRHSFTIDALDKLGMDNFIDENVQLASIQSCHFCWETRQSFFKCDVDCAPKIVTISVEPGVLLLFHDNIDIAGDVALTLCTGLFKLDVSSFGTALFDFNIQLLLFSTIKAAIFLQNLYFNRNHFERTFIQFLQRACKWHLHGGTLWRIFIPSTFLAEELMFTILHCREISNLLEWIINTEESLENFLCISTKLVASRDAKVTGATVFQSVLTVLVKDTSQLVVTKDFISLSNQCEDLSCFIDTGGILFWVIL